MGAARASTGKADPAERASPLQSCHAKASLGDGFMIGLPVKFALLAIPILLTGCTTAVYHPEKTDAEMRADVDLCTSEAHQKFWWDPIAAIPEAYDCLEAKGYSRTNKQVTEQVGRATGERRGTKAQGPVQPCRVPCR